MSAAYLDSITVFPTRKIADFEDWEHDIFEQKRGQISRALYGRDKEIKNEDVRVEKYQLTDFEKQNGGYSFIFGVVNQGVSTSLVHVSLVVLEDGSVEYTVVGRLSNILDRNPGQLVAVTKTGGSFENDNMFPDFYHYLGGYLITVWEFDPSDYSYDTVFNRTDFSRLKELEISLDEIAP